MSTIEDIPQVPLSSAASADQFITISTDSISANQINSVYNGPNGNQPNTYGNVVYIWQTDEDIPWSVAALNSAAIVNNFPAGSQSFDGLNVGVLPYVIAYAVGPTGNASWSKYTNVVASVSIPADGSQGTVTNPSIGVLSRGSTSLVAQINMLDGYNPAGSNTWVGVWEGNAASYNQKPKWRGPANSPNNNSTVSINGVVFTRGTTYTLGLFATGYSTDDSQLKQTSLAATHTFTV